MPTMTITCTGSPPGPMIVAVHGEIDTTTAPVLRKTLLGVGEGELVLDLSQVSLLAAAGLHVLLDVQQQLKTTGHALILAGASRPVRRPLAITGLDTLIPAVDTLEQACATLADPRPVTLQMLTGDDSPLSMQ